MVSRRTMIGSGAGAAVLAGLGYRAWDRGVFSAGKGPAYEAWDQADGGVGTYPSVRPVHAAILAASAHNSQPWRFEPHEDSITVYADLSRHLGAADPFRRELYVSMGCALLNLSIGAGHSPEVPLPDIEDRRLQPNPAPHIVRLCEAPLLSGVTWAHADRSVERAALARRHTNRGPYRQGQPLPQSFIRQFGFPYFITEPGVVKAMGELIVDATQRFIADPEMSRDSGRWFRTGRRQIEAHRDGVTTDAAGLSPAMNAMAKMMPDQDTASADKYWLAATRDVQVPTAAAYGVLFMPNRLSLLDAIATGANWQTLHLAATTAGLAVQPMNQPIEMMDRDHLLGRPDKYAEEIRRIAAPQGTDESGEDPAFIFRIGYAERPAAPSPRRKLEDVLRRTGFA